MEKIKNNTNLPIAQYIRNQLEDQIINNMIEAGTKLDESKLAAQFEVSRTPIREALRQLESSQLITIIPKKGAFVSEISIQKIIETFEVMAELESLCAKLAARRISDEEILELKEALKQCEIAYKNDDLDQYFLENGKFHAIIYQASNNSFLREQTKQLKYRLLPYRKTQLKVKNRMKSSFNEHKMITEAIIRGNDVEVQDIMRNHVLVQGKLFTDMIALIFNTKK
ncbi:MAG: GntR family transcriptional regulator [Arcobacter sp.]|nr:MAG: GntR family transcriptional regulator [Arcobacter sp.]